MILKKNKEEFNEKTHIDNINLKKKAQIKKNKKISYGNLQYLKDTEFMMMF